MVGSLHRVTLLLQVRGKNILTDPIFSERASPVQWAGPKRVVPPGIAFNNLPPIDFVLISHDHFDSLDRDTIVNLWKREGGDQTVFLVPLRLKAWFNDLGIQNVFELDFEEVFQRDFKLKDHWSSQYFGNNNPIILELGVSQEVQGYFFLHNQMKFFRSAVNQRQRTKPSYVQYNNIVAIFIVNYLPLV